VGLLSVGHAKVLLGIDDVKLQEYLCDLVIKEDMSVRQLEEKLKKMSESRKPVTQQSQDLPDEYFKVLEIVGRYFENSISLKRADSGKGSMTIHFKSDEEVRNFLKALEDSKF
jgi:ParB family chromosome partitioning protein